MKTVALHNKQEIESFLRKNVFLHIYSIGDLDDFFWNYTTWYGLKQKNEIQAIVLIYTGLPLPTILALSDNIDPLKELLLSISHLLPNRFYSHLTPGLEETFKRQYKLQPHGEHYKMALSNNLKSDYSDLQDVVRLTENDLSEILQLYNSSYQDNWFDPRMLDTDQYFGIKEGNRLVSIAGVHVYSKRYGVAALGNIVTHPDYRKRGYGKLTTTKTCESLLNNVSHIGLNVKSDNFTAISLYEKLGFEVIGSYGEYMVEAK